MDYVINALVNFLLYISIPLAIRYVILRKPIKSKWVAIGILAPIFFGFSILINIQRDEAQKRISQEFNVPYKPRPHMLGAPILYMAMALSYGILRSGDKKSETMNNESVNQVAEGKNNLPICPNCKTEISTGSIYCDKCGNKTAEASDKTKEISVAAQRPRSSASLETNTADSPSIANAERHIVIQQHVTKTTQVFSPDREVNNASFASLQEVGVDEDHIYASIARELETDAAQKGLWTKLFAECGGDEKQTKVLYIKQRAERLIYEERSRLAQAAREHAHEASRIEQVRLNKELADKIQALSASHTAVMMFTNVAHNNLQKVRRLLSEEPLLIAVKNRDRETPLHIAVREKNLAMARLLLEKGAITDENNCYWVTPLEYAKNSKQVEMVKLLTAQVGEFRGTVAQET